jgi:hypothetical protein
VAPLSLKEISIETASGLLNCDRSGNSSFSTSGSVHDFDGFCGASRRFDFLRIALILLANFLV